MTEQEEEAGAARGKRDKGKFYAGYFVSGKASDEDGEGV